MDSFSSPEQTPGPNSPFTLNDLHGLRNQALGYGHNREASITVLKIIKNKETFTHKTVDIGTELQVSHSPTTNEQPFQSVDGTTQQLVSFHVHPDISRTPELAQNTDIDLTNYSPTGSSAEMLPSTQLSFFQSNFAGSGANLGGTFSYTPNNDSPAPYDRNTDSQPGGSLNLITKDGVTLCVGRIPLDRSIRITSRAREKVGINLNQEFPPTWKILYGTNCYSTEEPTDSFANKDSAGTAGLNMLAQNGIGISRLDYYAGQQALLFFHLSWSVFDELADQCGGMDNIAFGDGLSQMSQILMTDHNIPTLPTEKSLAAVLTKPVFPIRRERRSILAQETITQLISNPDWQTQEWLNVREIINNLESTTEIETGIELRALLQKITEQIPWPDDFETEIAKILNDKTTGAELLSAISERNILEKSIGIDHYRLLLPDFFYDTLLKKYQQLSTEENSYYRELIEFTLHNRDLAKP